MAKWFYIAFAGGNQSELPQFAPPKPGAGEESKGSSLKKEKKAVIEKLAAQEAQMAELLKELEDARQREQKARKVSAELSAKLAAAQESAQRSADLRSASTRRRRAAASSIPCSSKRAGM